MSEPGDRGAKVGGSAKKLSSSADAPTPPSSKRVVSHDVTATKDLSEQDGWLAHIHEQLGGEQQPRLRLLYHCDLARVGAVSLPGTMPPGGGWVVIGRNDPLFVGVGPAASAFAIEDPYVSREQLRVRWLGEAERFEVEPGPSARRPLSRVDFEADPSGRATQPITGPTLLEPGSCLAIGDRVLLGLDRGRFHQPDADRMGLVGESAELWSLRDEIRALARFDRSTLVTGPTGAGKELVAFALHQQSPRASGPFVPVNCAALPEALVESVLFGHRRGAFTGAASDEKGLFRSADGGTLFLDEVGELPTQVQPKLLRVLQDRVVMPVGAHEGHRVNVRVITATHRDLLAQVRGGRLREDLYHRIAAHILRVPPLAERRFDIPELFVHMLGRHRAEHPDLGWLWAAGLDWKPALPIGFIAELMRADWAGNVRELQNVVERTALLNLKPGVFRGPSAPPATSKMPPAPAPPQPSAPPADLPLSDALRTAGETLGLAPKTIRKLLPPEALLAMQADLERDGPGPEQTARLRERAADALVALLEAHEYNQSAVALLLAVSRTTLIKMMDDLALPRAAELGAAEIAAAREKASGDLVAAARLLRVSPAALKKRLSQLGRKPEG